MKDISYVKFSKAVTQAGTKIGELSLDDIDKFLLQREFIIKEAIGDLGIAEGEPLYNVIRVEFCRLLKFCPDD